MKSEQVLIISFWNPTEKNPHQGVFIQDQAAAICGLRDNIVFLQVNVMFSANILLRKTIEESDWHNNRKIVLNLYTRLWKLWYVNPWLLAWVINRSLKNSQSDIKLSIIHSNVIFPCGVVGYLLARKMGVKTIISEHWSKAEKLLRHPLYRRIALRAYQKSNTVICVSEFLSHKIAVATGHKNLKVIPNIIDSTLFTYHPKNIAKSDDITFLCVATWRLPKRLDIIIEALSKYATEHGKNVELKVVGEGPQAEIMKKRRYPENFHIEWLGYLDKDAIVSLLHSAKVFLHASEIETFSIVTAEALSTGTPVVASNTGALPELINRDNGVLAENDQESWFKSISEATSKEYDYEAIARQNQTRFSAEKVGRSIISIYDECLLHQD